MKVHVKNSTNIRPAQETPKQRLRCTDLDLMIPVVHSAIVKFYRRPLDSSNFFEASLLKESLSNVLVLFYPMAGRLGSDEDGRIEINCNGEGVVFVEAETSFTIDDLGDFESTAELKNLVPTVEKTGNISSVPLLLVQVTHFKCGGVCLGVLSQHTFVDGPSTNHFLNSWGQMARGLPVSIPPMFDRSFLEFGVPNSPSFQHLEYSPFPSLNTPSQAPVSLSTAILKLSPEQINILKEESKKDHESTINFSGIEIVAAHIWRCACKARGLSNDQATKLHFPIDGRYTLNPSNPTWYVGNVVFSCTSMALSGDILSKPFSYTIERIHESMKQMDDEKYLKSALAYLKQQPDIAALRRGGHTFNCPNLAICLIEGVPLYNVDFGWGCPMFARLVSNTWDGMVYILPSPTNDGSLVVHVDLETNHLQLFKKFFYEIFLHRTEV